MSCFAKGCQNDAECRCLANTCFKSNYDGNNRLNVDYLDENWNLNLFPINECHSECLCSDEKCANRVVQNGPYFNFEIYTCVNSCKGMGLKTKDFIPVGSFVIEYMGEIISLDEAKSQFEIRSSLTEPNYIMLLKEYFSDKKSMANTVIDARNYSNLGRYVNHSCEPNLFILPVRIENIIPHAAMFSLRDICAGEELCYDYNGTIGINQNEEPKENIKINMVKCFCGSSKCKGFLPSADF